MSVRALRAIPVVAFALGIAVSARSAPAYLSPAVIAPGADGTTVYVGAETAGKVIVLNTATGAATTTFDFDGDITGLAFSPDRSILAVTLGGPEGRVVLADPATGKGKTVSLGHTPMAPLWSPDGATLYVANRFSGDVSVVDVAKAREASRIKADREPVGLALSKDAAKLFIANHLPSGPANGDYAAAKVTVADLAAGTHGEIPLPNGSTGVRGMAASPDGAFIYVSHILARYQLPTTQLERGWMNTNALTVIDGAAGTYVNTVLLDDVDLGAANPWGVACTADGAYVCVAHAGTHQVSVIDRAALHAKLEKIAKGERVSQVSATPEDVPNDLSFLVGIRRRLDMGGNGPRGICTVGGKVFAAEYFSDSVGVADTNPEVYHRPKSLPLGPPQNLTAERLGERYFNDADFCFQKWQSCASCHPDARADGLNWDLLNDGMGNPKQTKSMLYAHVTPPAMITAIRADAETAVRAGIRYIQFAVREEEDAQAIDAYLRSLRPVPSPYLVKGKMSREARRGEKVFKDAGCAVCHKGDYLTDLQKYDVGLGIGRHEGTEFDTPTLVENWRSAPFLYDGRAGTMMDVLTTQNRNDTHGKTSGLSQKELEELNEYIMTR